MIIKVEEITPWVGNSDSFNYLKKNNRLESYTIYFVSDNSRTGDVWVSLFEGELYFYKTYSPRLDDINDIIEEILEAKNQDLNPDLSNDEIIELMKVSALDLSINGGSNDGTDSLTYKVDGLRRSLNIDTDSTLNASVDDDGKQGTANWKLAVSKTPGTLTINGQSFNGSEDIEVNIDAIEGTKTCWDEF